MSPAFKPCRLLASVIALVGLASTATSQELEPRSYSAAPVGTTFVGAGYGNTNGEVVFDADSPYSNVHADVNMLSVAGGRVFGVANHQTSIGLAVPYAWGDVSGNVGDAQRAVTRSGFADPRFRVSTLLIGGPALQPGDFATRERDPILGASLVVVAPLGQYDSNYLVNIGSHRWAFKPEIGFSYPIGNWFWDAYAGVWLFEDNNDFLGGHRRSQDPLASYQAHISYTIRPGLWAAVDATYYSGGTTTVDGVRGADRQDNLRLGTTLSIPLVRGQSIKLTLSDGAVTRANGNYRSIGLGWQCAWTD